MKTALLTLVGALVLAGCASGSTSPTAIAKVIRTHEKTILVFHDPSVRCSDYIEGRCPTFRLADVTCSTSSNCAARYHLISDPTDRSGYLTVTLRVTAKGDRVVWKPAGQRCSDAGIPITCTVMLYG